METKTKLGLIGKNISYSFSKKYFESKFLKLHRDDLSYALFDLNDISEVEKLFTDSNLKGFNVTIPYKEKIIAYLDELSDEAEKIGAVNTVSIINGKKKGFNTDAFGFESTLLLHKSEKHHAALILGNGGAAKAVKYILEKHQIPYQVITRKNSPTFEEVSAEMVAKHPIIIQCTPVGTFPNISASVPFPFHALTKDHLVIDLIYNPELTYFLEQAGKYHSIIVNGSYMLEKQAEKAWEIWDI